MTNKDKTHKCSIVIPVYNSEDTLPELIDELIAVSSDHFSDYEIVLVNDGSWDRSWQKICDLAKKHKKVKGIDLTKNSGQHNAILCGIRHASHDLTLTMDDDLQHPPAEIPKLIVKLEEGYDVVYGSPTKEKHSLLRNFASIMIKQSIKTAMNVSGACRISAFRLFRTSLTKSFEKYRGNQVCVDTLLAWGTTRFGHVLVRHEYRNSNKSNYSFTKLISHAINMITGFSQLPLQMASILGISCSLFGFVVLLYVTFNFLLLDSPVQGFTFIASIISIFSGAQLLTIGIIGEYLARIHFRLMDKPQYMVKELTFEHEPGKAEEDET